MSSKPASLTIVVPCHNEEEILLSTYNTLKALTETWITAGLISQYEFVLVNNGSDDNTFDIMSDLYKRDKNVVIVDLRKDFGFQGSITVGLFHASKEMVVSIDADLQDDPLAIKEMIEKYYEGYEMVLGVRENRDSDNFLKRWTAQAFYRVLSIIGIKTIYNHADFRLLGKSIIDVLKQYPERVRYLRGLIFEIESHYAIVKYKRRKRILGKSKFNIFSLASFALDGIFSFSNKPIRLISLLGFVIFFISILGFLFVLYVKYVQNVNVPGWAFLAILVFFFGGVQNMFLGIIGEYISKIFLETKQRPVYLVRKLYSHQYDEKK